MTGLLWLAALLMLFEVGGWVLTVFVMYIEPNGERWGYAAALATLTLPILNMAHRRLK